MDQHSEKVSAQLDKPRNADLTPADTPMDEVTVTLGSIHASDYIQDLDQFQTNADLRAGIRYELMAAVNRQMDTKIINALSATSNSALSVSNTLNTSALSTATATFLDNDITPDGMWTAAISSGAMKDILNDNKLTSRDYVNQGLLSEGFVKGVMGWSLIHSTLLDSDTSGKKNNYFYHKNAVGLAIGRDVESYIEFVPQKDAHIVVVKALCGAVIIRPEGVQYAEIDD